jgi:hypothetical protein
MFVMFILCRAELQLQLSSVVSTLSVEQADACVDTTEAVSMYTTSLTSLRS